jgi:hypothetical protein
VIEASSERQIANIRAEVPTLWNIMAPSKDFFGPPVIPRYGRKRWPLEEVEATANEAGFAWHGRLIARIADHPLGRDLANLLSG